MTASPLPVVTVTRYVTPLREGGSLPGVVEGDDLGTYVCKFRGAGQGAKVLVAEVIVSGLATRLGLRTPRLVELDLDPELARYEADEEVQDLLNASVGANLGIDFLPGSFGVDGQISVADDEGARVLWLDAFTANVDRSWRNPNLLLWHGDLWVIDHGASLYFHHGWRSGVTDPAKFADQPWDVAGHVFETCAGRARELDGEISARLDRDVFDDDPRRGARRLARAGARRGGVRRLGPDALRSAYVDFLVARLGTRQWLPEVPSMSTRLAYQYVVLRCVPRPDREEFLNVGVVLHCQAADYLDVRVPRRRRAAARPAPGDRRRPGARGAGLRRAACAAATSAPARRPASRSDSGSASSRRRAAPSSSPDRCTAASPTTRPASSSTCASAWWAEAPRPDCVRGPRRADTRRGEPTRWRRPAPAVVRAGGGRRRQARSRAATWAVARRARLLALLAAARGDGRGHRPHRGGAVAGDRPPGGSRSQRRHDRQPPAAGGGPRTSSSACPARTRLGGSWSLDLAEARAAVCAGRQPGGRRASTPWPRPRPPQPRSCSAPAPALPDEEDDDWVGSGAPRGRRAASGRRATTGSARSSRSTPAARSPVASAGRGADPYDERAVRDLMRALAADGQVAAALAAYDRLARTLRDDLGTEPDRATADLHLALLRDPGPTRGGEDVAGACRSPRRRCARRPRAPSSPLLRDRRGPAVRRARHVRRWCWSVGEGGIGKTRLLDAVADVVLGDRRPGAARAVPPCGALAFPPAVRRRPARPASPRLQLDALLAVVRDHEARVGVAGAGPRPGPR